MPSAMTSGFSCRPATQLSLLETRYCSVVAGRLRVVAISVRNRSHSLNGILGADDRIATCLRLTANRP